MIRAYIRKNYISILSVTFYIALAFKLGTLLYLEISGIDPTKTQMPKLLKIITVPFFFAWIFQYFLIFSRKLRDEYLESIWQRSMRSFGVAVFFIPWIWLIAWIIHALYFPNEYWLLKDPNQFLVTFSGSDPHNISQLQKSGIDFALYSLLDYSPMLFVVLFKWHSWRDRR